MKLIASFLLFNLFCFHFAFSQQKVTPPKLQFQQISDGLSQNLISGIIQDHQGYIWAATHNGINRFDGVNFKIYDHIRNDSTSLPSNRVNQLFEDSKQQLWVATIDGLAKYKRETNNFEVWNYDENNPNSLSSNVVFCITEDKQGLLWVGTANGLNRIDPDSRQIKHFGNDNDSLFSGNEIISIIADEKNRIWVGTNKGLNLFYPAENKAVRLYDIKGNSIETGEVSTLLKNSKDNFWIGTGNNGAYVLKENGDGKFEVKQYSQDGNKPGSLGNYKVKSILEDSKGNLWIGSENGGLNLFNPEEQNFYKYLPDPSDELSIKSNSIWDVYEDKQGRLWIGTFNQGINISDPYYRKFFHENRNACQENGLKHNAVSSFLESKENDLWIGSDGGGISIWDREKSSYKYLEHDKNKPNSLGSNAVLHIFQAKDNSIWVGTWAGGLNQYNPKTNGFIKYLPDVKNPQSIPGDCIFKIQEDKAGNIWTAVFNKGVSRLDRKTGEFFTIPYDPNDPNSLSSYMILGITIDSNENIWVSTVLGLNKITMNAEGEYTVKKYLEDAENQNAISSNSINLVNQDSKGRIWIGTSSGLNLYQPEQDGFISFGKKDGLPNENIQGIIEDDAGFLWISTNRGVSKMSEDKNGLFQFRNYDKSDGLQGDEFIRNSIYKNEKGEIFLGGTNGFNYFHPDMVSDNPFEPNVQLTDFKLFNKKVEIGGSNSPLKQHIGSTQELILNHKQSVFSLDFISLNLTHSDKNQYAYMLEGLEKEWNYVGNLKTATYTNLNAGDYTFKVKASNNDGIWNKEGINLKIKILPPWWETWWFRGLLFTLLIGFGIGFYNYRTYKLKEQKRRLEEEVQRRTSQLQQANEEIQVQNEEMAQQAEELEQQRDYLQEANNLVSSKNEFITSSINYAKRIQNSVLPLDEEFTNTFKDHFVIFRPRDIVSGDFYWIHESADFIHFAVVDCTGHGVPGAFMSMIGSSLLNRIVAEMKITDPAEILENLDKLVYKSLKQDKSRQADGMDVVICAIDKRQKSKTKLRFSGAKNDLFVFNAEKSDLEKLSGDRISIGGSIQTNRQFSSKEIYLEKGSSIYLTTDGIIDQHRSSDRKRLGSKKLKSFLEEIQNNPFTTQKSLIEGFLDDYMEGTTQRDDIAFVGIQV